jgi:hypothetical protein
METAGRIVAGVVGAVFVVAVLDAAVRTFVLPRGVAVPLTRLVSRVMSAVFRAITRRQDDYARVDRTLALYGPITLLSFPAAWLLGLFAGFSLIIGALHDAGPREAIRDSGSALLTLGFATPADLPTTAAVLIEAAFGLALLALLISYLPTIYNTFSRREVAVSQLSVRAGTPPTAVELIERAHRTDFMDELDALFELWETWFVEVGETHTSFAILTFFRSPNPDRSWVTAAGAVLDAAALRLALLDRPWSPGTAVCIRAGFVTLREIATYFAMSFDADPAAGDPISITRDEFDGVVARLAAAGVPLKADLDQAWRDFVGWRVNYDDVLLQLAGFLQVPRAPWSSDRSAPLRYRPPIRTRRRSR